MPAEHVEPLLHLGALAIAATGGYLGIDKLSHSGFSPAFANIEPKVTLEIPENIETLKKLDLVGADGSLKKDGPPELLEECGVFWQYLICTVNDIPYVLPGWRKFRTAVYFFRRQRYIPFLCFFRKRTDYKCVSVMFSLSLVGFAFMVLSTFMEWDIFSNFWWCLVFYVAYLSFILIALFFLVILHGPLQKISVTCERCRAKLELRMRRILKLQIIANSPAPPSPPPPSTASPAAPS